MEKLEWFIEIHRNTGLNYTKLRILCEIGVRKNERATGVGLEFVTGIHRQSVYQALRWLEDVGYIHAGRLTDRGCKLLGLSPEQYLAGRALPR